MDTNSQRGFIANLQSFRTMVPGGLQFSIGGNRCLFVACSLYALFPAKWCHFLQDHAKLHGHRPNGDFR